VIGWLIFIGLVVWIGWMLVNDGLAVSYLEDLAFLERRRIRRTGFRAEAEIDRLAHDALDAMVTGGAAQAVRDW
jgi:hypothetical protein